MADDVVATRDRVRQVLLRVMVRDLVSADQLAVSLNDHSLAGAACLRDYGSQVAPYVGQWLEFQLRDVLPRHGMNALTVSLDARATGLVSPLVIEEVEVLVEYGPYPSVLAR